MKNRFKYRAWDKENKRYIHDVEKGLQFYSTAGNLRVMTLAEIAESSKYNLEQCTGLRDKNGKLIYEGDVINATPPDEWSVFDKYNHNGVLGKKRVVMRHGGFLLNDDNNEDNYWLYWAITNTCVKIIGNIHENPELLE